MKNKNVYLGKIFTNSPEDDVIVRGEKFGLDPRMIETEQYLGNYKMRQYVQELGLRYIRVICQNKKSYIFTN